MSTVKKAVLLLIGVFCFFACERVEGLSDSVSLSDFKLISHTPTEIELGEPTIKGDTIFIPVYRGISLFPLSINAEPIAGSDAKQVLLGNSFSSFSDIVFQAEDIDDKTFYLVAKSGLTKAYYIKLDIANQNFESDFKQLSIYGCSAQDVLHCREAYINPIKQQIDIHLINPQLPITLNTAATISENATIHDSNLQEIASLELDLNYQSLKDTLTYKLTAQSGKVAYWKICINKAAHVTDKESGSIQAAVSITQSKLSAVSQTSGYSILDTKIAADKGEITFSIVPGTDFSELNILPTIELPANSHVLGHNDNEPFRFTSYNDTQHLYVLDNRTGYYKKWIFKAVPGDITDILQFPFSYKDNTVEGNQIILADKAEIDNINAIVTLYVTKLNPSAFPLTVTPKSIVVSDGATTDVSEMTFTNMVDSYSFKVSAGGKDTNWKVMLKQSATIGTKADIEEYLITASSLATITNDNVTIDKDKAEVTIDIINKSAAEIFNPKLLIESSITLSKGAVFTDYQDGKPFEFSTFRDVISVTVQAENGTTKQWKVKLINKPQLPNAGFEFWDASGYFPTIDKTPGVGLGWATANNSYIQGTLSTGNTSNGGTYAAELTTGVVNNILIKNLITAGTLYVGKFVLSMNMSNPRSMTKFGIPLEAYPTAIKIDAKYQPGAKLQRSKKISGFKYELEDVPGQDKGQIWVELVHWSGSGNIEYTGEAKENIRVLARGERIFTDTTDWDRISIAIEKTSLHDQYPVTHIVVVMASSIDGHLFLGAQGSKLTVDNIELVY